MSELRPNDQVLVDFGLEGQVRTEVEQVYGPPGRRHVLVRLSPEVSGDVVDEPVTISVPLAAVNAVQTA